MAAYGQECTHVVNDASPKHVNVSKCNNQKHAPINIQKFGSVEDDIKSGKFSMQCDCNKVIKLQNLMKEEIFD